MADYSFVKDENGNACGIWLRDTSVVNKPGYVEVLLTHKNYNELLSAYIAKRYRVVPNNYNSAGGCFVMFDGVKAPGE